MRLDAESTGPMLGFWQQKGHRMATSAGWFEDPESAQHWRWWDGSAWGPRVEKRPAGDQPVPPAPAVAAKPFAQGMRVANKWASGVLVVAALFVLWGAGLLGGGDDVSPDSAATPAVSPPSMMTPSPQPFPAPEPEPAPESEPSQDPVTVSSQGDGNTAPFELSAGDYVATISFGADCAYYLDLEPTPDDRQDHDIGNSSEAQDQTNYLYGVEEGRYYIRANTGPAPACPWSVTLEHLP